MICFIVLVVLGSNIFFVVTFPAALQIEVTLNGDVVYSEVVGENLCKPEAYVEKMTSRDTTTTQQVQEDVLKLWTLVKMQLEVSQEQKNHIKSQFSNAYLVKI